MSGDPTTFQMPATITVIYINSVVNNTTLEHKLTQTDWGNLGPFLGFSVSLMNKVKKWLKWKLTDNFIRIWKEKRPKAGKPLISVAGRRRMEEKREERHAFWVQYGGLSSGASQPHGKR